jgi:hypothetical protein
MLGSCSALQKDCCAQKLEVGLFLHKAENNRTENTN